MEHLGTLLREIRTARGWSLGRLAARSGVSKATLSRWESGSCLPRVPELTAVMDALEAGAEPRARLLACLEAPRSVQLLRASRAGPLPSAGDLLRALRLRGRWTQAQVASRAGVDQSTVARWERGDRLPSSAQMQALCFALAAQEEEVLALTSGRCTVGPTDLPSDPAAVTECIFEILLTPSWDLVDLRFLIVERALWRRAVGDERSLPLLATAYTVHAQYLSNHQRWEESRRMAERALAVPPGPDRASDVALRATLMIAAADANAGRGAPDRAVRRLAPWLSETPSSLYAAWVQSDMARYLAMIGQSEGAIRLSRQAASYHGEDEHLRQIDAGRVLLMLGMPGEALERLPALPPAAHDNFIKEALVRSEAHLSLGASSEAHDWLLRAYSVIDAGKWSHLRPQADRLAARL